MNLRYASTLVRAVKAPPAQTSTPAEAGPSSWFLTRVQMKIFTSSHMKVTLKSLEGKKKKKYHIKLCCWNLTIKNNNTSTVTQFKKNSKISASRCITIPSAQIRKTNPVSSEHNTITAYKLVLFFFFKAPSKNSKLHKAVNCLNGTSEDSDRTLTKTQSKISNSFLLHFPINNSTI